MTRIGGEPPPQREPRTVPHWLVVLVTGLCFSLPIALMILMALPLYKQQPDLVLLDGEAIVLGVTAALIGTGLAGFAHRNRGRAHERR